MHIQLDPEENELKALRQFTRLRRKNVLEIGCGNGRLTWRYADQVGHVTAIDPWAEGIARAQKRLPEEWKGRVEFRSTGFTDFAKVTHSSSFDIAILAWSL